MFTHFFYPSWRWWQRNAAFYNLRSMSRCLPWEADAATTSEKKGFKAKFFRNTFFTHIPWARRPSGFERNSKADKNLRGIIGYTYGVANLIDPCWRSGTELSKNDIFWWFFWQTCNNLVVLEVLAPWQARQRQGTRRARRSNPAEWTWKMGQNLKKFEFSGLRKSL